MKQETAYLNALAKVTHYSIEGNKLTLYDANNLIIAEFSK
ncbi:MAG: META domain-containing protein [Anaerolineales bacterium]|nr:META domain-containing protein [Anaerolineales bacterium]